MGAQARIGSLTFLTDHMPNFTISESAGETWINLWCGFQKNGQKQFVAQTKVDQRFFNSAETDYHKEIVDILLDAFVAKRLKELPIGKEPLQPVYGVPSEFSVVLEEPKPEPPSPAKATKKAAKKKKKIS